MKELAAVFTAPVQLVSTLSSPAPLNISDGSYPAQEFRVALEILGRHSRIRKRYPARVIDTATAVYLCRRSCIQAA